MILPIVLVLIGLLALTMAGFIFFIRAETAGTIAIGDSQQARLAAESGFEELVARLRQERDNAKAWFDDPKAWRNRLVFADNYDRTKDPFADGRSRKDVFDSGKQLERAWRYSVVAPNLDAAAQTIRYGITPETSKLNINSATDEQLRALLMPLLLNLNIENAPEIVDAILDWRDGDDDPRDGGAEMAYYNGLTPPYNVKNGPFTTIEELLLVKGVNAAILYGEDVNQNGLLDANEDDGDASFPPYDNGDGILNHGIAPFLTVWSREPDTAIDNKPRINLSGDASLVKAQIDEQFLNGELTEATIAFILMVKQQGIPLRSPADLYPGSGTGGAAGGPQPGGQNPGGQQGTGQQPTGGAPRSGDDQSGGSSSGGGSSGRKAGAGTGNANANSSANANANRNSSGGATGGGAPRNSNANSAKGGGDRPPGGTNANNNGKSAPKKSSGRQKAQDKVDDANPGARSGGDDDNLTAEQQQVGSRDNPQGTGKDDGKDGRGGSPADDPPQKDDGTSGDGAQDPGAAPGQDPRLLTSPITVEEMPYIMDRFTTKGAGQEGLVGLININTAPVEVLRTLPGITPESAAALVAARLQLDATALRTTAWPLVSQAIDVDTWQQIAPYITTKSYQFHIEIIGYGDHTKIARRMEWIVEMLGPLPQIRYQRDLTALGMGWPVDDDSVTSTR